MSQHDQPTFRELLENDPKLRAFNNTVPAGILVIGLDDGQVVFSNRFFDDLLGVSGDQLLGRNWDDFFVDHDERQELMVEFAANDEVRNFELRLKGPDGREVWGLASLSEIPLDDEDMLLFAFTDVSELKRTEQELSRTTAEQEAISQTVPAGILVISLDDGSVVYSNRFFSDLLGFDGEKLLGANWDNFFVDKEERQEMMVEFAVNDVVRDFELRLLNADGETVWGLASLSMIEMDEDDLLLFAFSDVSKLKQMEIELSRANEELKELADVKNRFLGMAAHDLRTPIGAIRSMSELITRLDMAEEKKAELTSSIMEVSDQMMTLLNDLLDVSAIESGTFDLDKQAGDLGNVLRRRVELVGFSAEEKDITIDVKIDEHPTIEFDHNRVGQVIDNLLTNAIKFSQPGATVEASVSSETSSVTLAVKDCGVGISQSEIDKLFIPFEKLSSRPTAGEKSTGLGLSIAKKIIDAHGGEINVQSARGEGSTFKVSLPIEATSITVPESGDTPPMVKRHVANRKLHILVVDDNELNRQIIAAFLDELGHRYTHAENGEHAIEEHRSGDFDLILMDVQMPVMSGPDATRAIRKMEGPKALMPIIALTADASETNRQDYLDAGMNGVVTKPIDQLDFATTLNEVLGEDIHVPVLVVVEESDDVARQSDVDTKNAKEKVDAFLRQLAADDD